MAEAWSRKKKGRKGRHGADEIQMEGGGRTCAVERRGEARRIKPRGPHAHGWEKKIDRRRGYVTVDLKLSIADGTCASSTERNENRPPGD